MNKYITVLLVALAATGVEAQDYQFVLRVALGNIGYSEVHNLPVDNGIKKPGLLQQCLFIPWQQPR